MKLLAEKIAIVTGGSQGIGKASCIALAEAGAMVIATDLQKPAYEHENIEFFQLNVTDETEINRMVEYVLDKYGDIDILVNNAGITSDALTAKLTNEMWERVIDVNLKGTFNMTRVIGPLMMKQGSGSIINLTSGVGIYGNIGQANYAASKAGVIGMTKTWAKEFGMKGDQVRVNAIAPSFVKTDIIKTVPEAVLEMAKKASCLKRLANPEEIASVVVFLASDMSSYVTSQVIEVSGGMRA